MATSKSQAPAEQQQQQQQVEAPVAREGAERTRPRRVYAPRTDIYETDQGLVVLADMPGVSPNGVDVTLEREVLTIRGRVEDETLKGFTPLYQEYETGNYERVFTLSEEIDRERIEASVKDGVLRLVLPKAPASQARRIRVRAAG
jgi:HSP20 family protein